MYSIPELPGGLGNSAKLDKKILAKAEQLTLHPRQEHMRLNIAKALVGLTNCRTHRHNVPVTKALNRDILAAEKERKKRRKEEEEEVPYMV